MKNLFLLLLLTIATYSYGQREIKDQSLILNNGTDRDVTIEFNIGLGAANPKFRFNVTDDVWEFSHDGSVWETYVGLEYTDTQLALKAPLASPALTGVPTAPTAAPGDNSTQIATTEYADDAVATLETALDARLDAEEAISADHETRIDTLETDTTLDDHIADTSAHGTVGNVVGTTDTQTLTNKTIDLDSNTLSNIEVDNFKSGVIDADLGGVSASHDTLPTALGTKTYVDAGDAANALALSDHLSDTTDAHDAAAISVVPSGNLTATDVAAALNELQGDSDVLDARVDTAESDIIALDAEVVKLTGDQSIANVKTFTGKLVTTSTTNGAHPCPSMTDAQMLAATAADGDCVHNTTLDTWLVYSSTEALWQEVGGGGGISPWVTAEDYEISDVVIESRRIYQALTDHTSGTFATDLASGDWQLISDEVSLKSDDGTAAPIREVQTPYAQITQTDTGKAKIETGNKNRLINAGFEHGTVSTGWTCSATGTATCTLTADTSTPVEGLKSIDIECVDSGSSGTCLFYQDTATSYAVQGLASVYLKSDSASGVAVYSRIDGANIEALNVETTSEGQYKVPVVLGLTSTGIAIEITVAASQTITVKADEAFVGAQDLVTRVDQTQIAGESNFAGTAGCDWSRTSTTIGAFTADADCVGPTIEFQRIGQWQTTDSDLPRQTINNLPAGYYEASFYLPAFVGTNNTSPVLAIFDGTTTCKGTRGSGYNSAQIGQIVTCTFFYTQSGNRSFELYTATSSGTSQIPLSQTSPQVNLKFILKYYGSSEVYTSQCNGNIACTNSFSADISATGVISNSNVAGWLSSCTNAATPICTLSTQLSGSDLSCWHSCDFNSYNQQTNQTSTTVGGTCTNSASTALSGARRYFCSRGTDFKVNRDIKGDFAQLRRIVYLKDVKASGTGGGAFASGAWQIRTLNTVEGDSTIVGLSSNQFTLQPGQYKISATASAYNTVNHKIAIYNVTTASYDIIGLNASTANTANFGSSSPLYGELNITSPTVYELRHRCSSTGTYGTAATFGTSEVYSIITIQKTR